MTTSCDRTTLIVLGDLLLVRPLERGLLLLAVLLLSLGFLLVRLLLYLKINPVDPWMDISRLANIDD